MRKLVEYLQYLLLIDVSSDFITKGGKWFAFSKLFWNRIPKVCSVIHESVFHVISTRGFGKQRPLEMSPR